MTQDEIIEMARDSGMELYGLGKDRARFVHHLEAFAKLIAEKALKDHAMQKVQRLGQEIEQEPVRVPWSQALESVWAEQETVAWMDADGNVSDNNDHKCFPIPLYTHPPQRKPLTDEQIFACENSVPDEVVSDRDWCIHFARAIEAAHNIQENT